MIRILGVGGTWSTAHEQEAVQWYQKGAPLYWFIRARGFTWLVGRDGRVFRWTGRLAGHQIWRTAIRWVTFGWVKWKPSIVDWEVLGDTLYDHVCPTLVEPAHWLPACVTHLWLHSHAGNGGFFACAKGLIANTFTTFCTPPRQEMVAVIKRARARMGFWVHVHSNHVDKVAIAGTLGDGDANIIHKFSELVDEDTGKTLAELGLGPDLELFVDDGHSRILTDSRRFDRLDRILDIMKERHGRPDYLACR